MNRGWDQKESATEDRKSLNGDRFVSGVAGRGAFRKADPGRGYGGRGRGRGPMRGLQQHETVVCLVQYS